MTAMLKLTAAFVAITGTFIGLPIVLQAALQAAGVWGL